MCIYIALRRNIARRFHVIRLLLTWHHMFDHGVNYRNSFVNCCLQCRQPLRNQGWSPSESWLLGVGGTHVARMRLSSWLIAAAVAVLWTVQIGTCTYMYTSSCQRMGALCWPLRMHVRIPTHVRKEWLKAYILVGRTCSLSIYRDQRACSGPLSVFMYVHPWAPQCEPTHGVVRSAYLSLGDFSVFLSLLYTQTGALLYGQSQQWMYMYMYTCIHVNVQ